MPLFFVFLNVIIKLKEEGKMKLRKQNKKIEIQPKGKIFIIKGSNHTYKHDTPHTVKAISKLYGKGFKEGYIDLKMVLIIAIVVFFVCMFIVF